MVSSTSRRTRVDKTAYCLWAWGSSALARVPIVLYIVRYRMPASTPNSFSSFHITKLKLPLQNHMSSLTEVNLPFRWVIVAILWSFLVFLDFCSFWCLPHSSTILKNSLWSFRLPCCSLRTYPKAAWLLLAFPSSRDSFIFSGFWLLPPSSNSAIMAHVLFILHRHDLLSAVIYPLWITHRKGSLLWGIYVFWACLSRLGWPSPWSLAFIVSVDAILLSKGYIFFIGFEG